MSGRVLAPVAAGVVGAMVAGLVAVAGAAGDGVPDPEGGTIPPPPPATTAPAPPPAAGGAPRIVQFHAPRRFWCLPAHPGQAQVTIGWSVPAATAVTVLVDGRRVPLRIRRRAPFAVLAGTPSGIGATVVFACRSGTRHRVEIRWRAGDSPPARKVVSIRRAGRR